MPRKAFVRVCKIWGVAEHALHVWCSTLSVVSTVSRVDLTDRANITQGPRSPKDTTRWTATRLVCIRFPPHTHIADMRTNIDIDDDLLAKAMAATGLTTKKATVEEALRRLVLRRDRLDALSDLAGIGWEGDLPSMREGRATDR